MPDQEHIDSFLKRDSIEAEKQYLLTSLNEIYAVFKRINNLEINLKSSGNYKQVTQSIKEYSSELQQAQKVEQEISATRQKINNLSTQRQKILIEEKEILRQTTNETKNLIREQVAQEGSIESLRAKLIRLNKEYDNLSAAQRNAPRGFQLKETIAITSQELKNLEGETGRFQRNVGNYGNAITATFTKAYGGLRNLANLIPGLGISGLLLALVGPISSAASSLFTFGKALSEVELRQKAFTAAVKEAGGVYSTGIKLVLELRDKIQLAKDGFLDKDKVLKEYNSTLGKSIGEVKNLDAAESLIIKNGPAYIAMTLQKGIAEAAYADISKKAYELKLKQNELTKLAASDDNSLTGITFIKGNIKRVRGEINDLGNEILAGLKVAQEAEKEAARIAKGSSIDIFGGKQDTKPTNQQQIKDQTASDILKTQFEVNKLRIQQEIDSNKRILDDDTKSYNERLKALRDFGQATISLIELENDFAVKAEKLKVAETIAELEKQKRAKGANIGGINQQIEKEKQASTERLKLIDAKYFDDLLKASNNYVDQQKILSDKQVKIKEDQYAEFKKLDDDYLEFDAKMRKALNDAAEKDKERRKRLEEDAAKELLAVRRKFREDVINTAQAFGDAQFEKEKNRIQDQMNLLDEKTRREIDAANASALSEQDKAAKISAITNRAEAEKRILEKKQKDEDIKKAQFDKGISLFNIAIKTAEAVLIAKAKAVAAGVFTPAGIAYLAQIPFLIASGALQAAIILARPIPRYKHGKNSDNYEGPAIVGDGGKSELHVKEDGSFEVTPNTPTLTYVKKRDVIYPDANILMNMATINAGRNLRNVPVNENNYSKEMVQALSKKFDSLERAVKNIPQPRMDVGTETIMNVVNRGINQTKYINQQLNF